MNIHEVQGLLQCVCVCLQGLFVQLTEAYCNQGNIAGATTLLDHMKNVELPITEQIYASLITGHSRCGNMEEAERIIRIMQVGVVSRLVGVALNVAMVTAGEEAQSRQCILHGSLVWLRREGQDGRY